MNPWSLYHSSVSDIYFLKMHTTIDNWHILTLKNHGKTPRTWHFFLALLIFLYKCLFLFSKVCESLGTLWFFFYFSSSKLSPSLVSYSSCYGYLGWLFLDICSCFGLTLLHLIPIDHQLVDTVAIGTWKWQENHGISSKKLISLLFSLHILIYQLEEHGSMWGNWVSS